MKCKYGLLFLSLLVGCRAIPVVREHSFGGGFGQSRENANQIWVIVENKQLISLKDSGTIKADSLQKNIPRWKALKLIRVDSVSPALYTPQLRKANALIEKANVLQEKKRHSKFILKVLKVFLMVTLFLFLLPFYPQILSWILLYLLVHYRSMERYYRLRAVRLIKKTYKNSTEDNRFNLTIICLWMLRNYYRRSRVLNTLLFAGNPRDGAVPKEIMDKYKILKDKGAEIKKIKEKRLLWNIILIITSIEFLGLLILVLAGWGRGK